MDNEYDIEVARELLRQEMRKIVREVVPEILKEFLKEDYENPDASIVSTDASTWVDMTTLVSELNVSRQTIYNWMKDERRMSLLKKYIRKAGRRISFNLAGFKAVISSFRQLFISREWDGLNFSLMNEENKKKYKLGVIKEKAFLKQKLTKEERLYLKLHADSNEIYNPFP